MDPSDGSVTVDLEGRFLTFLFGRDRLGKVVYQVLFIERRSAPEPDTLELSRRRPLPFSRVYFISQLVVMISSHPFAMEPRSFGSSSNTNSRHEPFGEIP